MEEVWRVRCSWGVICCWELGMGEIFLFLRELTRRRRQAMDSVFFSFIFFLLLLYSLFTPKPFWILFFVSASSPAHSLTHTPNSPGFYLFCSLCLFFTHTLTHTFMNLSALPHNWAYMHEHLIFRPPSVIWLLARSFLLWFSTTQTILVWMYKIKWMCMEIVGEGENMNQWIWFGAFLFLGFWPFNSWLA